MVGFLFGRMFFWDLFVIGLIATARLPKKDRYWLRVLAAFAACTMVSVIWSGVFSQFTNSEWFWMVANYAGAFAAVVAALAFCVRMEGWKLLYMGTTVWFIQHSANCIDFICFPAAEMGLLAFLRHGILVLAMAAAVYGLFLRRLDYYTLNQISFGMTVPIWLAMCMMCLLLNSYASVHGETSVSFYLADLICNLVGLLYQGSIYHLLGIQRERSEMERLLLESERQYQQAKENMELVNIKSHDLRYLLRGCRKEGGMDETALIQIEQAVDGYDSAISTGNPALDVILTEKSQQCQAQGIGFTCMADGRGLSAMNPADLYALFGNAFDNAIEAVSALPEAQKKQISLTMRQVGTLTTVLLQNYTQGTLSFVDGLPLTSKEDRQNHGFGVKSMRLLVEKYKGELQFGQDEDIVTLSIVLPCQG